MSRPKESNLILATPVSTLLTDWINNSECSQVEIAKELGLQKPNVISMFKSGRSPLPARHIAPLANYLGRDPVILIDTWMLEYMPDLAITLIKYKAVEFDKSEIR